MIRTFLFFIALNLIVVSASAQSFYFPKKAYTDSLALHSAMESLAKDVIVFYKESDQKKYLTILVRLQILAGEYSRSLHAIDSFRAIVKKENTPYSSLQLLQFELFAKAKAKCTTDPCFTTEFNHLLTESLSTLEDKSALYISTAFVTRNGIKELKDKWESSLAGIQDKDSISLSEAINICSDYMVYVVFKEIEPLSKPLLIEDDNKRYIIDDSILIKTKDGAFISATVVRKRSVSIAQPTALVFTIYTDYNLFMAKTAAACGYVGVVALSRGKGLSTDMIAPYEYESTDVNGVIDWIISKEWSNGKVGMYGGSYNGFSQWAATKKLHPALKTIVPYAAAIPGLGRPMHNNVFINANYQWDFYVTNNKYLDNNVNNDWQRWETMRNGWYKSGVAYRKLDSIDGTHNQWFQRRIQHPSYDKYWQSMVPFKEEYAKINIPVLTFTGYYDDGQISAMHYLNEHYKYNKNANHYLIIGPYDHFGTQRGGEPILRDYAVDPVSLINTRELTFTWLDYILKDGRKPELLKDKINYEVMGANVWRHAPSVKKMNTGYITFYLSNTKIDSTYKLLTKRQAQQGYIDQEVNLADRTTTNNDYYPDPIIRDSLDFSNGLFFISEPFNEPFSIDGAFTGKLRASINKKDMDIGIVLYEVMPDGRYFHLSYFLGRASYAQDMSVRKLLRPGVIETIPFERSYLVSRQLSKGSRLLIVLNINKNPFAQINYGTGKEVSDEDVQHAGAPLKIKWYTDSFIKVPIRK